MSDQSWDEWKKKYSSQFINENGESLPAFYCYWLAYNRRTPGKTCQQCKFYLLTQGKPRFYYCDQYKQSNWVLKRWNKDFPACGLFEGPEVTK